MLCPSFALYGFKITHFPYTDSFRDFKISLFYYTLFFSLKKKEDSRGMFRNHFVRPSVILSIHLCIHLSIQYTYFVLILFQCLLSMLRGDNLPEAVGGQLLEDVSSLLVTCTTVLPVETTVKLVTSVSHCTNPRE